MPEREQFYQDVIAKDASDQDKANILAASQEFFDEPSLTRIASIERPKSPDEAAVIDIVRQYGDRLTAALGAPEFPVSAEHFHIVPSGNWPEDFRAQGVFNLTAQQIALREPASLLTLAHRAFHEYIHLKSYGAAQIALSENSRRPYRVGFEVYSRDGNRVLFSLLNEAITEELARSFTHETKQRESLFRREAAVTERLRAQEAKLRTDGSSTFDSDVYYASQTTLDNGDTQLHLVSFGYPTERRALNLLIDKIARQDAAGDLSSEDVYWRFVQGAMNGHILPIGKLIDRTFGNGTFRQIGEMTDSEDLLQYVSQL